MGEYIVGFFGEKLHVFGIVALFKIGLIWKYVSLFFGEYFIMFGMEVELGSFVFNSLSLI